MASIEDLVAALQQLMTTREASRSVRVELLVPTYTGPSDPKTPHDFLEELERYQLTCRCPDGEILTKVIPAALKGAALRWLSFVGAFDTLEQFRSEFLLEFAAVNYKDRLRAELRRRTQGPNETLSAYIHCVAEYFRRIDPMIEETEKVRTVMDQCHPDYRNFLRGKTFATLADLAREAKTIQADLLALRMYAPPPSAESALEPSLAYAFATAEHRQEAHVAALESFAGQNQDPLSLGLAAIDPFTFHRLERVRASQPKQHGYQGEKPRSSATGASAPRAPPPLRLRCWTCNRPGHLSRDCFSNRPGN